jgi:hypothetical protein
VGRFFSRITDAVHSTRPKEERIHGLHLRPSTRGIVIPSVAKTDMGEPLFKAPDGGRFEILWEREDLAQSEPQRGQKLPCSSLRWFAQKPFRPAYPCPCGQIFMQYLGYESVILKMEPMLQEATPDASIINEQSRIHKWSGNTFSLRIYAVSSFGFFAPDIPKSGVKILLTDDYAGESHVIFSCFGRTAMVLNS